MIIWILCENHKNLVYRPIRDIGIIHIRTRTIEHMNTIRKWNS